MKKYLWVTLAVYWTTVSMSAYTPHELGGSRITASGTECQSTEEKNTAPFSKTNSSLMKRKEPAIHRMKNTSETISGQDLNTSRE